MLPNGSVENITSRAKMKGYDVAYAPSFKNSLFSVAKFCNNDNKVFFFNNTKTYGICLNDSTRSLLNTFIDASEKCDSIQVSGVRDMKSNIYTASVDNIKPYSESCSCSRMPPKHAVTEPPSTPSSLPVGSASSKPDLSSALKTSDPSVEQLN